MVHGIVAWLDAYGIGGEWLRRAGFVGGGGASKYLAAGRLPQHPHPPPLCHQQPQSHAPCRASWSLGGQPSLAQAPPGLAPGPTAACSLRIPRPGRLIPLAPPAPAPAANDVANAFGTSVGSKTLKLWMVVVIVSGAAARRSCWAAQISVGGPGTAPCGPHPPPAAPGSPLARLWLPAGVYFRVPGCHAPGRQRDQDGERRGPGLGGDRGRVVWGPARGVSRRNLPPPVVICGVITTPPAPAPAASRVASRVAHAVDLHDLDPAARPVASRARGVIGGSGGR